MLSLCMIVKNEEDYIGRALSSVREISGEIVAVDTGSADKTIEIAKEFGAKIFNFEWNDDFSEAKNFMISKATGEWILSLDADEIIAKRDLQEIVRLTKEKAPFGYKFIQRTYLDKPNIVGWAPNPMDYPEGKDYPGFYPSPLVRLFRNDPRIRFRGKIHELVEPSMSEAGLLIQDTDIPIHHYGMIRCEQRSNQKMSLYAELEEKRARENPQDVKLLVRAAFLYKEIGQFDKADRLLKEVLSSIPDYADAYHELALLHEKKGDFPEAEEFYKKAISYAKDNGVFHYNCGNYFKRRGQSDEAIKYLVRAKELNPRHFNTQYLLGEIYFNDGDMQRSLYHFQEAVCLYPNHSSARHNIGVIYYNLGNKELAAEAFKEAIRINPEYGMARFHLGLLYAESGKIVDARKEIESSLRYTPENLEAKKILEVISRC